MTNQNNQLMTTDDILLQKRTIAELMSRVLKDKEHYGVIPGTQKPTLYKSGAEIIALSFGIHPEMTIQKTILEDGKHREYEVTCVMKRNSDGMAVGFGVGQCSTMESKYRWRKAKKFNNETKRQEEEQIENPNLEDLFNTVLKMAKKRAFVDAVISTTGASDFLTQDIEDFADIQEPPAEWEAEIKMINDLNELKTYWTANKGRGAKFDKCVMVRKAELETAPTPAPAPTLKPNSKKNG